MLKSPMFLAKNKENQFFLGGSITKSVDRSVGPSKWKPCPSKTPAFFSNGFNVRIRSDIAMVLVCGSVFIFSF